MPLKTSSKTGKKKTRRDKMKSSKEEVDVLKKGVKRFGIGQWVDILRAFKGVFNPIKIQVHLKDKWCNLHMSDKV